MIPIERVKELLAEDDLTTQEAEEFRDACYALVRSILDRWVQRLIGEPMGSEMKSRQNESKDYADYHLNGDDKRKKAIIYCRVSSLRQKNEGNGLDSQEQRCRKYAAERGYPVEEVFPDSFSGGGDFMARPAMAALLHYLDEHPERRYVVIFDDLKRFARDTIFHLTLRRELNRRHAIVECLNFRFEDTPEGEFIETILAAQGELERKQNRRQVIQKQRARLERGYWPFYPPPGYTSKRHAQHGRLLIPREPLATIISEALEGFASKRFTTQSDVQRFLEARGFHEHRLSRRVHLEQVKRLLTRVIYAGYVEYQPWNIGLTKGHHQPLISFETYQRIQDRLRETMKIYDRKDLRIEFPLRGFMLCAHCLAPYTASFSTGRGKKYPYYRCTSPACPFRNKSLPASQLHADFERLLGTVEPNAKKLTVIAEVIEDIWQETAQNIAVINRERERKRASLDAQIAVLLDRIKHAESGTVVTLYESELEKLMRERLALESPVSERPCVSLGTAMEEVFRNLKEPLNVWQSGILTDRRWLLTVTFTERIAYDSERGFGTAKLSPPLALSGQFSSGRAKLVEMVRRNWKQLEDFILYAHGLLRSNVADGPCRIRGQ